MHGSGDNYEIRKETYMKKIAFLLAAVLFLSIFASSCANNATETTTGIEQTTASTAESTAETPVTPPVSNPWKTAVWSKEPWWENTRLLVDNVNAVSYGAFVISEDIQNQEDDTLLAVEAVVRKEGGITLEEQMAFISSFGFEMISYPKYDYTKFCVFLATKEQLMRISFPEEYTVGVKLAFAAEGFYNEVNESSQAALTKAFPDGQEEIYGIIIRLKAPERTPYPSAEGWEALWESARARHPIPPRSDGKPDSGPTLEADVTPEQLFKMLTSDGFFDDCKIDLITQGSTQPEAFQ